MASCCVVLTLPKATFRSLGRFKVVKLSNIQAMKVFIVCSLSAWLVLVLKTSHVVVSGQDYDACEQPCQENYAPVCGSDGTIYFNACQLRNSQCWDDTLVQVDPIICGLSLDTDFSNPDNTESTASPSYCDEACPSDYDPVCGSDGSIYLNQCVLQKSQCLDSQLTMVDPSFCGLVVPPPMDLSTSAPLSGSMISDCQLSCTTDYTPVCGTDGVTYTNTCAFETARCLGATSSIAYGGECVQDSTSQPPEDNSGGCIKACTPDYNPVCGTDGATYYSECYLENAMCNDPTLSMAGLGGCQDPQPSQPMNNSSSCDLTCTQDYVPVCGTDGTTYSNSCTFQIAQCLDSQLQLGYSGSCTVSSGDQDQGLPLPSDAALSECQSACTMNYWPLCGSDGVTYNNACELQTAQCVNNQLSLAYQGVCRPQPSEFDCDSIFTCTTDISPVCGSDGTTYPNLCTFRMVQCINSQLQLTYAGACVSSDTTTTTTTTTTDSSNPNDYCGLQCDQQYNPVCGTDNRTYLSPCELLQAKCYDETIEEAYEGQCTEV